MTARFPGINEIGPVIDRAYSLMERTWWSRHEETPSAYRPPRLRAKERASALVSPLFAFSPLFLPVIGLNAAQVEILLENGGMSALQQPAFARV